MSDLIPPLVIPPNVFANEPVDVREAVGEVDFFGTARVVKSIHLYALFIQPVLASYASSGAAGHGRQGVNSRGSR